MSLIVFSSIMWFRKKGYEIFLLIHIVLSAVIIAALFWYVLTDLTIFIATLTTKVVIRRFLRASTTHIFGL
jgi:hypothetical protein